MTFTGIQILKIQLVQPITAYLNFAPLPACKSQQRSETTLQKRVTPSVCWEGYCSTVGTYTQSTVRCPLCTPQRSAER